MGRSLFRPREIDKDDLARKRAAIGALYSNEWADKMPWYQVLAVYKDFEKRGRFDKKDKQVKVPPLDFSRVRKAKRAPKKDFTDGVQLSFFDEDYYERQKSI